MTEWYAIIHRAKMKRVLCKYLKFRFVKDKET